jgi:hypothetical protein
MTLKWILLLVLALAPRLLADDTAAAADAAKADDGLAETLTEMRNSLESLNRLRFSGYLQAQYVDDERSRSELGGATGTAPLPVFLLTRSENYEKEVTGGGSGVGLVEGQELVAKSGYFPMR